MLTFAQFERDLIVERTKEGLKSAPARESLGPKKNPRKIDQALKLYAILGVQKRT